MEAAEFRSNLVSDEGMRFFRGKDLSTTGPGSGEQRAILDGDLNFSRNQLLNPEFASENDQRRKLVAYINRAYPNFRSDLVQTVLETALRAPNNLNLYEAMLIAAIYFRQLANIDRRSELTSQLLDQYARPALGPLWNVDMSAKKLQQKKLTVEEYRQQVKGVLLRYLRLILSE